jgi:hypothetical protein
MITATAAALPGSNRCPAMLAIASSATTTTAAPATQIAASCHARRRDHAATGRPQTTPLCDIRLYQCCQPYGSRQMPASPNTPPHIELLNALSLAIHSPALVSSM